MIIGEDFEAIQFDFLGLHLEQPNVFITDIMVGVVAIYLGLKIKSFSEQTQEPFFRYWELAFYLFCLTFTIGGFSHLFYSYTSVLGKYPSYIGGVITIYFIEQAMLSIIPKNKLWVRISKIKAILAGVLISIFIWKTTPETLHILLSIPSTNSVIGLLSVMIIIGLYARKNIHPSFVLFLYSLLAMLPATITQNLRLSITPWFDRHDISHFSIILSLFIYYKAIKTYGTYKLELDR